MDDTYEVKAKQEQMLSALINRRRSKDDIDILRAIVEFKSCSNLDWLLCSRCPLRKNHDLTSIGKCTGSAVHMCSYDLAQLLLEWEEFDVVLLKA